MNFEYPLNTRSIVVSASGDLHINASANSASTDYDFLLGSHAVHHRQLKERLKGSNEWIDIQGSKTTEPILAGIGNLEQHYLPSNSKTIEAMALRLFNPTTRLWSLYWADSMHGTLDPPLHGSFENNLGVFFGRDVFKGAPVLVQFQYDKTDIDHPVWGQAFSNDEGASWEWNWFMYFTRLF